MATAVTWARERPGRVRQCGAGSGRGRGSNELTSGELAVLAQGAANSPSAGHVGQTTTGTGTSDRVQIDTHIRGQSLTRPEFGVEWRVDPHIAGESSTRLG